MSKEEIYISGLKNDEFWNKKKNFKKEIKIFVFFLAVIFISRKSEMNRKIGWVNGNRGYENYFEHLHGIQLIFHGTYFQNLKKLRKQDSVLSGYSIKKRLMIFFTATFEFVFNSKKYKDYNYFIEFSFIYNMLNDWDFVSLTTTDIYDRVATWMSYLCLNRGIDFNIIAHGIVHSKNIPSKIHANSVSVFNKKQIYYYKEYIISNNDCNYYEFDYISLIDFKTYEFSNVISFGIASQNNNLWIENIIRSIQSMNFNQKIVIMLHPLDHITNYKNYKGDESIVLEPDNKYINVDYLIVQNSTIVFDYISNNFQGKIIQIDDRINFTEEFDLHQIIHLNDYQDLCPLLKNEIEKVKKGYIYE